MNWSIISLLISGLITFIGAVISFIDYRRVSREGGQFKLSDYLIFVVTALGVLGLIASTMSEIQERQASAQNEITINSLKATLEKEVNTIKSFTANINIGFRGDWDEGNKPFDDTLIETFLDQIELLNITVFETGFTNVSFYATRMWRYEFHDGNWVFIAAAAVKPSDQIIGKNISVLTNAKHAFLKLPLMKGSNLMSPFRVAYVTVDFKLNGKDLPRVRENVELEITKGPDSKFPYVPISFSPRFY